MLIAFYVASDPVAFWAIPIIVGFAACVILNPATTSVIIEDGTVRFERYFRTKWRALLSEVEVEEGRGGDGSILPAIILRSKANGAVVGQVVLSQFSGADAKKMMAVMRAK